ncbi:MAG: polysaccharide deacetylase family protein, partial [Myxococcota bacterium]
MPTHSSCVGLAAAGCLAAMSSPAAAEPIIAPYRDGAAAAVSFTFDDADDSHTENGGALDQLDARGVPGTFYVTTRFAGGWEWERFRIAHQEGHEIGNHSYNHPSFTDASMDVAARASQFDQAQATIAEKLDGFAATSFAYPYGAYNPTIRGEVLAKTDFDRACKSIYYDDIATKTGGLNARFDEQVAAGRWVVGLIHGTSGARGPAFFRHIDRALEANRDEAPDNDIWFATFSDVARYVTAREHVALEVAERGPGLATVTLSPDVEAEGLWYSPPTAGCKDGAWVRPEVMDDTELTVVISESCALNLAVHSTEVRSYDVDLSACRVVEDGPPASGPSGGGGSDGRGRPPRPPEDDCGDEGETVDAAPSEEQAGCGCSLTDRGHGSARFLTLAGALALVLARRRERSAPRQGSAPRRQRRAARRQQGAGGGVGVGG